MNDLNAKLICDLESFFDKTISQILLRATLHSVTPNIQFLFHSFYHSSGVTSLQSPLPRLSPRHAVDGWRVGENLC